jgi:hypothetical protein
MYISIEIVPARFTGEWMFGGWARREVEKKRSQIIEFSMLLFLSVY